MELEKVMRNLKMREIPPTHFVREIHCYQVISGLSPLRSNYNVLNEINELLYTSFSRMVKVNDKIEGYDQRFWLLWPKMIDITSFN